MKNKTLIVIRREYVQRLKSKGFIISTILAPVALSAAIFIPVATTVLLDDDTRRVVYVVNDADVSLDHLRLPGDVDIVVSDLAEDSLKAMVLDETIDGYLLLPAGVTAADEPAKYVSRGGGGLQFRFELERSVERIVRDARLVEAGVGNAVMKIIDSNVDFHVIRLTDEGEGADTTGFLSLIGYVMALVIYISVFLYGSLVMRSVIEEKTSRIVEIVISSVHPFQLMLGKVLGVGAVGLTQLLIWTAAVFVLASAGGMVLGGLTSPPDLGVTSVGVQSDLDLSQLVLPDIPFSFFVYFILSLSWWLSALCELIRNNRVRRRAGVGRSTVHAAHCPPYRSLPSALGQGYRITRQHAVDRGFLHPSFLTYPNAGARSCSSTRLLGNAAGTDDSFCNLWRNYLVLRANLQGRHSNVWEASALLRYHQVGSRSLAAESTRIESYIHFRFRNREITIT